MTDNVNKDLEPTERMWQPKFKKNVINRCACESYRNATEGINNFLERDANEMISYRTLQDMIKKEGMLIKSKIQDDAEQILKENGIDPKNGEMVCTEKFPLEIIEYKMSSSTQKMMKEKIEEAVNDHNSEIENTDAKITFNYEDDHIPSPPHETVSVAVDGVGVEHQKEKRDGKTLRGEKFIQTDVAYIRSAEGIYRVATDSITQTLLIVLAYLLKMHLLVGRNLEFFIDGENKIRDEIERIFYFCKFDLYLDWFHLRLKCYQKLSMALYGGKSNKERNSKIRSKLYSLLFIGKIDEALKYIDNIDKTIIKNNLKIKELKDYIIRKKSYIYNYALRQRLGLINSSNQCEKSNEMIVTNRCKHKGMSWTSSGLNGMRNIQIVRLNNEVEWYAKRQLLSRPVPLSARLKTLHAQFAADTQANKSPLSA